MRLLLAAASLCLVAASPALAAAGGQDSTAPTTASTGSAPTERPRLICRRENVTGSLAGGRRTCRTADEWREEARIARERGERVVGRNVGVGPPVSGGPGT